MRGGQAFQSSLADFKKMAMQEDGAARLQRVHPAIYAWLQVHTHTHKKKTRQKSLHGHKIRYGCMRAMSEVVVLSLTVL